MNLDAHSLAKLKEWEALRLKAYQDDAGTWTIGYGHTLGVRPDEVITAEQAESLLVLDTKDAVAVVNTFVKVPLTQNQFGALVSFEFNTGALTTSTLLRRLNASRYDEVPEQLMRWIHVRNPVTKAMEVSQGLINRRRHECELWGEP